MKAKQSKAQYTLEFKQEAKRHITYRFMVRRRAVIDVAISQALASCDVLL
jgi:hypothetical protein